MKKYVIIISTIPFAIFFIILLNIGTLNALDFHPKFPHFKFMQKLTEEQQKEVKTKMKELWESGASREEMRESVHKMLEEYGVDFPNYRNGIRGKRGPRHGRGFMKFTDQLSDDQKKAIKEKVKTLREEGASREEIHAQISKMLEEYEIDLPEDFGQYRKLWENLTKEQRKSLRVKMREMRKEGDTPETIRDEIHKMLQEFGINDSADQTLHKEETSGEKMSIRNYPNPFNPETNIEYQVKSSARVSITIYDVQGKRVKMLADDFRQPGSYNIKWNGINESGTQVPSGVYFIRISAGNETLNHRIIMMK